MTLERKSGISLHMQLEQMLRRKITSNEWPAGTLMPSENQISQEYGISRMTVRGAINKLAQEGLVERVMGKGTYVSHPRAQGANMKFDGIISQLQKMGYDIRTEVLSIEQKSGRNLGSKFTKPVGGKVYELQRLRYLNDSPMSIHISHIPVSVTPNLETRIGEMEKDQLFVILEREYGVVRGTVCQTWNAISAPEWVTELLQIEPGQPVLMSETITRSPEGKEFHAETEYFRGDKISLYFEFQ